MKYLMLFFPLLAFSQTEQPPAAPTSAEVRVVVYQGENIIGEWSSVNYKGSMFVDSDEVETKVMAQLFNDSSKTVVGTHC